MANINNRRTVADLMKDQRDSKLGKVTGKLFGDVSGTIRSIAVNMYCPCKGYSQRFGAHRSVLRWVTMEGKRMAVCCKDREKCTVLAMVSSC